MFDLEAMPLADLRRLQADVNKAVTTFEDRKKREAVAALAQLAREHGFDLSELSGVQVKRTRKGAAPKYAHPADPTKTWSGRGRTPAWFADALANGAKKEDLAV